MDKLSAMYIIHHYNTICITVLPTINYHANGGIIIISY